TQIEWAMLHLERAQHREGIGYLNRALRLFGELEARRELLNIRRKLERMERLYLPAVKEWGARALTPHQAEHAERVAAYSYRLGVAVGLDGWELTMLRVGALVHDIGKTVVRIEYDDEYDPGKRQERNL